jgi:hypothetical protein
MRENFANFATTQLAASVAASDTTFSVTAGAGSQFPATGPFLVLIDTEFFLIASRSADTFTIQTRGFDNSTAASHSLGASVIMTATASMLNHLWQNIADTFHPDVPPIQSQLSATGVPTGSPTSYDTEFESAGAWTIYPASPSGGSIWSINTALRSHLLLYRGGNDSTLYTAYVPFTYSGQFVVTTKIFDGISIAQNGSSSVYVTLFVSDSSNPVSSADSGNRVRCETVFNGGTGQNSLLNYGSRYARTLIDTAGSASIIGPLVPLDPSLPVYLRINYSGANFRTYIGNGTTFIQLVTYANSNFTPRSIGIQFASGGINLSQTSAVDFVRFQLGTTGQAYGP